VLATSGVLAIVLGYSAQSSLSHVFAGLSLNLNPNFSQGDYVEIDGRWGRVIDMNWRYVTLQDTDENYLSIPNSVVANATIKNFMHPTSRRGLTLYVTVPHDISPVVVKGLLRQATKASPSVLDAEGSPWVTLSELTEDGARYQIAFYITGPFNSGVKDEVLSAVWYSLQRQGIPIAINRREVMVQPPAVKEMIDYTESVFKLLQNIPLFHTLRDTELREIAAGSCRFAYGPPECIIQENDTGSSLFIVESGLLDVYAQQSDQSSLKMAEIGPGSVFGEMALLTGEPRSATIRAASEVSVYEISKSTLQPVLQNRPELIEELSMLLATRQLDAEMKSSAYQSEHAVRQTTVDSIATRIAGSIRAFFHSDSDC
jgi:CRP-like cAMP-binding protein